MRILHISTADQEGGAARAALRLHHALLEAGAHSQMLVRDKTSQEAEIFAAALDDEAPWVEQTRIIQKYSIGPNRTSLSNTYFSIPLPGFDLSQDARVQACDVLHLHWITGLLSPPSIARLQKLGKPIFWTCHDQRPFTGGCHYSAGCGKFQASCEECPQLACDEWGVARAGLAESLQSMDARGLTLLCPSRWMAAAARRSALFSQARIEWIPYCIDSRVFKPRPKSEARQELGLAHDKPCFLFGADHGAEKRKGFAELANALNLLPPSDVQFASFGDSDGVFDHLPVKIKSFGRISSDQKLATLYAAADAFLLPSLEDNLPNMMIEAMACGTPVIGFDIGGLPDFVTPETGVLVRAGDCSGLADAIRNFKPDAQRAMSARAMAEKHSPEVISRRHLQLYAESRPAPRASPGSNEPLRCLPPGPAFTPVFERLWEHAQKKRPGQWWRRFIGGSKR